MATKLRRLALTSTLLVVGGVSIESRNHGLKASKPEIAADGKIGSELMSKARQLEEDMDISFVADYSIKFQGCHHISQWNEEADDDDDVRISTKRLARFRLCPSGSCQDEKTSGCTSKYGDYVVEMNTFVESHLQAMEDRKEYLCQLYEEICNDQCDGEADDNCEATCYKAYDLDYCLDDNDGDEDDWVANFDPMDYSYCAQFEFPNNNRDLLRRLDGNAQYYVGPYCADQGGEIRLGLFTDDSCTTFSSCDADCFYENTGYELPYSGESLISQTCMPCAEGENEGEDDDFDPEVKEVCEDVYSVSGKCETKMNVDYPNESACTYIEGIKIIREDGVIRTTNTKKSKAAAVCIGLFTTVAVLLGAYVYYLRTKLGRAKINLSSGSSALT